MKLKKKKLFNVLLTHVYVCVAGNGTHNCKHTAFEQSVVKQSDKYILFYIYIWVSVIIIIIKQTLITG